jgi:hypothetical protein
MSEATRKEQLMQDQDNVIGTCSVCGEKDVEVRHFETCAATGEGLWICTTCQPPNKGGDDRRFPHLHPGAVSVALAEAGFRGAIKAECLSMLTRWAQEDGLQWVVEQVFDDTGLTRIVTSDTAHGNPRFFFTLWETRDLKVRCHGCETADELLYFSGERDIDLVAWCDRCHLARSLTESLGERAWRS